MSFRFQLILTGGTFALSAVLFLVTGVQRRRLDAVLRAHGQPIGAGAPIRQLGLFEAWRHGMPCALTSPERRWTYDQDYLVQFLGVLHAASQVSRDPRDWLAFYRRPILTFDIAFAAVFSAFIALASGLIAAYYPATWLRLIASTTGALGLLYGLSDILEDVMLKRILHHAEDEFARRSRNASRQEEVAVADAAQTDAANTLTRLKLITLSASIVGLAAFLILFVLDLLLGKMGGPRSSNRVTPQTAGG